MTAEATRSRRRRHFVALSTDVVIESTGAAGRVDRARCERGRLSAVPREAVRPRRGLWAVAARGIEVVELARVVEATRSSSRRTTASARLVVDGDPELRHVPGARASRAGPPSTSLRAPRQRLDESSGRSAIVPLEALTLR